VVCSAIAAGLSARGGGVEVEAADPLMRPVRVPCGLSADGHTAVVEIAKVSGLQLLTLEERDPRVTTTHLRHRPTPG
jgi:glycerate 2-kinase